MLNEAERNSMKTGLVLEGGAMRGIYTAGVLDVFMEHEMHFDGVIGVSAGALHGCSFVSGQKGRSIRYYEKYRGDKHFMSFWSLLCTGDIVGEKFCYHEIPQWLDPFDYEAFYKSDTDFYVGCSNLETGKPEYLRIKDMLSEIDLMRASASMPYVSRIVKFHGMKLLDGGCTDSIPVRAFQRMGYQKNVVVLTRHEGYAKEPELLKPAKLFTENIHCLSKLLRAVILFTTEPWNKFGRWNRRVRFLLSGPVRSWSSKGWRAVWRKSVRFITLAGRMRKTEWRNY